MQPRNFTRVTIETEEGLFLLEGEEATKFEKNLQKARHHLQLENYDPFTSSPVNWEFRPSQGEESSPDIDQGSQEPVTQEPVTQDPEEGGLLECNIETETQLEQETQEPETQEPATEQESVPEPKKKKGPGKKA